MGRLTLNILLSFAQFEREVIGERIRDKIAASRKKGMWMGGCVPLGYDVKDRKLVVNEAKRRGRAVDLRAVRARSARRPCWRGSCGRRASRHQAGQLIDKGYVYKLLNNRVYIGGRSTRAPPIPGEHEAIIDRQTSLGQQQPAGAACSLAECWAIKLGIR